LTVGQVWFSFWFSFSFSFWFVVLV